jgi:ubiquinone/menaquinone biosynthesis C-methylase UbiE
MLCAMLVLLGIVPWTPAQDSVKRDPHQMHAAHRDSKKYIEMLEDPKRDAYQKPQEVLAALELKKGQVVADIGAGSGYFTFRLAERLGEKGRVYAVDVSPDMILHMNRRIRDTGARNVVTLLAPADDPLLAEGSQDKILIVNTWHHIENQPHYLALLKRILKPGGQIVMIDFHKRELPVGPPLEMKIAREDLIRQMEAAGFRLLKEHDFLPHQYFLIFSVQ